MVVLEQIDLAVDNVRNVSLLLPIIRSFFIVEYFLSITKLYSECT